MARVPYVHVDTPLHEASAGDLVALDGDDHHHLTRVLRLRDGAEVELADGSGASIRGRLNDGAVELLGEVLMMSPARPTLTVAQALPKGRKLDEVVRQVTELGADRIVPLVTARSVPRLEADKAAKAVERWAAVARAACEQARRPTRPEITSPVTVETLSGPDRTVLVTEPTAVKALRAGASAVGETGEVVIAVGPEGGWDGAELEAMRAAGALPVRLGPHVLRTEHAAAAALAIVASVTGRWP